MRTPNAERYPWIRKWGELLCSQRYYIEQQQELAAAEDAPETAIYRGENGVWHTIDSVASPHTRRALGLPPLEE